jgi:hypothetical protein
LLAEEFYDNSSENIRVGAGDFSFDHEQSSEENEDSETEDLMLHFWASHSQGLEGL